MCVCVGVRVREEITNFEPRERSAAMELANQNGSRLAFLCNVTEKIGVTNAWMQSWKDNKPRAHEYACRIKTDGEEEEEGEGREEEESGIQARVHSQGVPQNSPDLETHQMEFVKLRKSIFTGCRFNFFPCGVELITGSRPSEGQSPIFKKWSPILISGTMPRLCHVGASGEHAGMFAGFYLRTLWWGSEIISKVLKSDKNKSVYFTSFRNAFCPTKTCYFC